MVRRNAAVPGNAFLSDDIIRQIIDAKASKVIDNNWEHVKNLTHDFYGTIGRFGYQKSNDDAIKNPKLYMVEVHVYRHKEEHKQYRAAIVVVQLDEKTRTPLVDKSIVFVKDGNGVNIGKDIFDTTFRIGDNEVIQFGWTTFDDLIKARNDELVAQGKFTQEQIDDMIANYGCIVADQHKPRLRRN